MHGCFEIGHLVRGEPEGIGQELDRIFAWRPARPALEIAHTPQREPRTLRELLLG
jgi:hypothetical protein